MTVHNLSLIKGHGSENTFFIIDNTTLAWDDNQKKQITLLLCDAKYSSKWGQIDGILFMEPGKNTPTLMRIFNADGSEALMCGNGMRLAGRWTLEMLQKQNANVENVTHLPYAISHYNRLSSDVYGTKVELPKAEFHASFIGTDKQTYQNEPIEAFDNDRKYTSVHMPNPHIIAITDHIDDIELAKIGAEANNNKALFPEGVNVSWVKFVNKDTLFVSTYERGVGLTSSCGTAMMASSIVAVQYGSCSFNEPITVQNKGGYILATIHNDYSSTMIGNATYLAKINIDIENNVVTIVSKEDYEQEIRSYDKLKSSIL